MSRLFNRLSAKGRQEQGFTMVEMMVVLIIIAVLIAAGVWFYVRYIDRAKVTEAVGQINSMAAGLDSYYAQFGKYPADEKEAIAKAGLPEDPQAAGQLPKDPWGVKYEYSYKSDASTYTLTAKDDKGNDRVVATGTKGVSTVEVK